MLGDLGLTTHGESATSELVLPMEYGAGGMVLGMVWLFPTGSLMARAMILTRVHAGETLLWENRHINRASWSPQHGSYRLISGSTRQFEQRPKSTSFVIPSGGLIYTNPTGSPSYQGPDYWNSFFAPASWSNTITYAPTIADIPSPVEPAPAPANVYTAPQIPLFFVGNLPANTPLTISVKCAVEEPTLAGGTTGGLSDDPPPPLPEDPEDIDPEVDYDLEPDEVEVTWEGTIRAWAVRV